MLLKAKPSSVRDVRNIVTEAVWDVVSERRIKTLHIDIQDRVRNVLINAEKQGIYLRVTSAFRSFSEQNALYAKGRTAAGKIVTYAKAGESNHNYGVAFDVVEIADGKAIWTNPNWYKIGAIGKAQGFDWGGDWTSFKDKPHFEDSSLAKLLKKNV